MGQSKGNSIDWTITGTKDLCPYKMWFNNALSDIEYVWCHSSQPGKEMFNIYKYKGLITTSLYKYERLCFKIGLYGLNSSIYVIY